ncbi:hypothetical protein INS49_011366 [Diaporthe citri]|uniref:uncharacterized protein n=1 Tax=Diaporthe citri TaxID=83186 RepID=UPI001C809046|nr:uncharacterized protein INS49_011366 [Diaporthe citri]KAG6360309.1 hypothetical protein INS49_011366 [Diaporthe citri]
MASVSLSTRDLNILEKIQDPEFDPSQVVQVDETLPKDPHITDVTEYERIATEERRLILTVQQAEIQLAGPGPKTGLDFLKTYEECVAGLSELVSTNPSYASARNNRAQATRRLHGDGMLVSGLEPSDSPLVVDCDSDERRSAARRTLWDLDTCISLLTPSGSYPRLSRQAARTLSSAHTQRAAIYHQTSKMLAKGGVLNVDQERAEAGWEKIDFEEAASRDFALGGRYGNEVAKGLAVSTNPTAKLCGQMVREAMKKEYGPAFSG